MKLADEIKLVQEQPEKREGPFIVTKKSSKRISVYDDTKV